MGAWGYKPFENDAALDFLGDLKRARKANRIERLRAAFQSYFDFHERATSGGKEIRGPEVSAAEIRHMLQTAQSLFGEYADADAAARFAILAAKSDSELKAELRLDRKVGVGSEEAHVAVAAAWLLLDRLGVDVEKDINPNHDLAPVFHITLGSVRGVLADISLRSMRALPALGAKCLKAVLSNKLVCDSWSSSPLWKQQVQSYHKLLSRRATANSSSSGRAKSARRSPKR